MVCDARQTRRTSRMSEPVTRTATVSGPDPSETADSLGPVPHLVFAFGERGARRAERRPLFRPTVELGRGGSPLGVAPLDDKRISRRHARLERVAGRWQLTDLDSRNGTTVDGQRVERPTTLRDRAVIRVGDTLVVFREAPMPSPIELVTAADFPLVGISAEMGLLRHDIADVAPRPIATLVLGETGTGKEVVARALHSASGRPGAFVAVNCAALPPPLLESTLFGHVRGAFTGADRARPGLLREAEGGTLFLDELGEMPAPLQAKLLRALETREVRPVGGTGIHPIDVRLVSATHRDLAEAVRARRFRLDLYGRLAHWTMRLPPLRDRREDVPQLAAAFTDRPLDAGLVEALMLHPWPLNVRGLRALIARAEVGHDGPLKLDRRVRAALEEDRRFVEAQADEAPESDEAPAEALTEAQGPRPRRRRPGRQTLEALMTEHQGHVAGVARALDASRQQVYRWLRHHALTVEAFRED